MELVGGGGFLRLNHQPKNTTNLPLDLCFGSGDYWCIPPFIQLKKNIKNLINQLYDPAELELQPIGTTMYNFSISRRSDGHKPYLIDEVYSLKP